MSICIIEGLKKDGRHGNIDSGGSERYEGIPKKSTVVVLMLPQQRVVHRSKATEVVAIPLDPGKYRINVQKLYSLNNSFGFCYSYDIYHDCEEGTWQKMQALQPTLSRVMNTTEGPRWRCKVYQCGNESTSSFGAVKHEGEHFGIDVIEAVKSGDKLALTALSEGVLNLKSQITAQDQAKRTGNILGAGHELGSLGG